MKKSTDYVHNFLTYLKVEKDCSEHTLTSYEKDLAAFTVFMREYKDKAFLWEQVNALDVRAYLSDLNKKQYARRTIARRISALRSFYKYLVRENVLESCRPSWTKSKFQSCWSCLTASRSASATEPYWKCCMQQAAAYLSLLA